MTKKEMENKKAECIAAGRVKVVEKTDTEEAGTTKNHGFW